jgi:holin-like protein
MKYLFQIGIIAVVSFIAEVMHYFIPLPVPASVYGIVILFLLLMTGTIKLEQVEKIADYFMAILPILFLAPSVGLMESVSDISGSLIQLILMMVLSTVGVTVVTGLVAQAIMKKKKKQQKEKTHE